MRKPIDYKQYADKWKNKLYTNTGNPKYTMSYSGCGPTSAAMVLSTFVDKKINPWDVAQLSLQNGFRVENEGTAWALFGWLAKKYNLDFYQTSSTGEAVKALQGGNALAVCIMGPGYFTTGGHYILAYDVDKDGNILVNDPISPYRVKASRSVFIQQCQQYFIFYNRPYGTKKAIDKLVEKGIIVCLDYWLQNAINGFKVEGGYVQVIIMQYARRFKAVNSFAEGMEVLKSHIDLSAPDYWLNNAVPGKQISGTNAACLIIKIANTL